MRRRFPAPDVVLPTEFDGLMRESFASMIRNLEQA
jgi:hypothetical protein